MSGANEAWSLRVEKNHWYSGAADFALRTLGKGTGNCLVIGSPPYEANAISELGWNVTFLDVRTPPAGSYKYVNGDAMHMPFEDDSFDALSSTCVLCHAGMGRYDDPVEDAGDEKMLAEMYRVMKPGTTTALMWGPCGPDLGASVEHGITHRVYAPGPARSLVMNARFSSAEVFFWYCGDWLPVEELRPRIADDIQRNLATFPYLAMVVTK